VARPDGKTDDLGLKMLDEPAAKQSDPTVLNLQLRQVISDFMISWFMISWFMVHGSWFTVHGSWSMVHGSWLSVSTSRTLERTPTDHG
jgi:hypothetical protein